MNRSRMFLLAAVAFLVAIGVAAFTYQALSNRMKPADDTIKIVVAALPVSVGARLTEADVRLAEWPKSTVPEGSFTSLPEVIGRGVLVNIVTNEPILATKLAADGAGGGLSSTIPEGMRAITLKVNDVSGVAGFVGPGSRVDIILSGSPTSGNIEMAKVILENMQVLGAGQNVANDANGRPLNVPTVTLLATPEQTEVLALAQIDGRIQLALRNPLDMVEAKPNAVRREHLFSGGSVAPNPPAAAPRPAARVTTARRTPAPAPVAPPPVAPPPPPPVVAPPPARREVQLIQGNQINKVQFEAKKDDAPSQ